jgi:hypothetical protein
VARDDRLHARPPAHDVERWTEGSVVAVEKPPGRVVVTVRPETEGCRERGDDGNDPVDLRVSEAVYDLFVGRVAAEHRSEGDVLPGAPVWYRERGQESGRP